MLPMPAQDLLRPGSDPLMSLPGGWLETVDVRGMRKRLPPPVPDFLAAVQQRVASMQSEPSCLS